MTFNHLPMTSSIAIPCRIALRLQSLLLLERRCGI